MKKRLLCSILLLSLVTASGCGKETPKQAEAADTQATEAVTEISEEITPTAPEEVKEASVETEDAEAQDEYPSISKVSYDTLFTLIDKEELQEFAFDYMQDRGALYNQKSSCDNFEVSYMGSLFEAYGAPETEDYINSLTYFYKIKYTITDSAFCKIAAIKTGSLTLKEEGKFDDIQFYDVFIPGPEGDGGYPYDDEEFAAYVDSEEVIFTDIGRDVNPNVKKLDKDQQTVFLQAFVDGTLSRDAVYDSTSEDYNSFFEKIIAAFDRECKRYIDNDFPELSDKNSGTFSQD